MLLKGLQPYDFLDALAKIPKLEKIRLYVDFEPQPDEFVNTYHAHLDTDRSTIRHLASYLYRQTGSTSLATVEVVIGDQPRDETECRWHRILQLSIHSRPDILFVCRMDENGNILVEDDTDGITRPEWAEYMDRDGQSKLPGRTYPRDIDGWNCLMDEAERAMAGHEMDVDDDSEGDLSSLFGSPLDVEIND